MEWAGFFRAGTKHKPLMVQLKERGIGYNPGTVGTINSAEKAFRIGQWEKDWQTIMPRNEEKVTAALFPAVSAVAAADIKRISIIALRGLEKADQSLVADA